MVEEPYFSLARWIANNWLNDDFTLIIIYGTQRIGKSAYAFKVMAEVYNYLWGLTPMETIKRYMKWHPRHVVNDWYDLPERIPVYCWDDAGYWLNALQWHDPLLQAVQKYMNVVGTDMNALILTTPDPRWVLTKIREMPGTLRINVFKRDGGRKRVMQLPPSKRFSRIARGYLPYLYPDLKKGGVNPETQDEFSCRFPDDIYKYYFPERKKYARMAKQAILDQLNAQEKIKAKTAQALEKKRRLKKDLRDLEAL